MAKKKKVALEDLMKNEAPATPQLITETLEKNYMPYRVNNAYQTIPLNQQKDAKELRFLLSNAP